MICSCHRLSPHLCVESMRSFPLCRWSVHRPCHGLKRARLSLPGSSLGGGGTWFHETSSALVVRTSSQLRSFALSKPPLDYANVRGASTIFALSTAPGRAAIAVVRISGPACEKINSLFCPGRPLPKARHATLRTLHSPFSPAEILDSGALALYFPPPNTTTGEPVLELHTHGSPAIVNAILSALAQCSTSAMPIRPAEPGEFTRRAFLNDRLSLPQVEALGDTLAAVTEEQRRISVQAASSDLGACYEKWRQMLLEARGELEALIDFAEDQHFDEKPSELAAGVAIQVRRLISAIQMHSQNAVRGELLRNGIAVCLLGLPNVGKSSILNHIVGRNAAIVSREAGTTRDVIEVGIDLGGFLCRVGDTAGIRSVGHTGANAPSASERVGEVEQEGIRRAKAQAQAADVVVLVLSIEPSVDAEGVQLQLDEGVLATARELLARGKPLVVAINKTDRYGLDDGGAAFARLAAQLAADVSRALPGLGESRVFAISVQRAQEQSPETRTSGGSGCGRFGAFLAGLVDYFRDLTSPLRRAAAGDPRPSAQDLNGDAGLALGATARQRALLDQCVRELRGFLDHVERGGGGGDDAAAEDVDIVVAAESLRAAAACLAKITGRGTDAGDVEEVLGVVFEKFCVGK